MKYIKMFESFIAEAVTAPKIDDKFIESLNNKTVGSLKSSVNQLASEIAEMMKIFGYGAGISVSGDTINNIEFNKLFKDGSKGSLKFDLIKDFPSQDWHATAAPLRVIFGSNDTHKITLGQLLDYMVTSKIGANGSGNPELKPIAHFDDKSSYEQFVSDKKWNTTLATLTGKDEVKGQSLANVLGVTIGSIAPQGKSEFTK